MNNTEFTSTSFARPPSLMLEGLLALGVWLISMLVLRLVEAQGEILVYWGVLTPCGILLYCLAHYWALPHSLDRQWPAGSYAWRVGGLLLLLSVPVASSLLLITRDEEVVLGFGAVNFFFHLLVTAPVAWFIFHRRRQAKQELDGLKTELGQSAANLDLLRAQINPHFLFNALNTLYGTALQENSERTAQGIQMLGDMMRFMLHENHLPLIPLAREVEHLRHYVTLQSLRTATSPTVVIHCHLAEAVGEQMIAPMLLIPFVENAFKHGIRLQQRSWIKLVLHVEPRALYFDVYNSLHDKREPHLLAEAPSGVGLGNVQQRLALLYPGRHELVIRQTVEEYFVHLTLQL